MPGEAGFTLPPSLVQDGVVHGALVFASCFGPQRLGPSLYSEEGLGPFGEMRCGAGRVFVDRLKGSLFCQKFDRRHLGSPEEGAWF